jgi:hypothetical protein
MPALSDDWLKQNSLDQKAGMALKAQPIYIQARDIVVEGSAG